MTDLPFERFARVPFQVNAILITEENLEQVADLVGEIRTNEEGERYIAINRKIVPTVGRAFVGWYLTSYNDALRCYSPSVFNEQFVPIANADHVTFEFPRNGSSAKLYSTSPEAANTTVDI